MLAHLQRRLAREDGISLMEVLVAFMLLGIVMSGSVRFFSTTLLSLQSSERRTHATALANEELENLRTIPWGDTGFYEDDFAGTPPTDTVVIDPARPAASVAPLPEEEITRAGVPLQVDRSITWIDNSQTGTPTDYKRLVVDVSWQDRGRTFSVSVQSVRSPNPDEQEGAEFVLSLLDVLPNVVYTDADGWVDATANPGGVDLSARTSTHADFVTVSYLERGAASETTQNLGSTDLIEWTGTLGSAQFRNGDVTFTFIATKTTPYEQQVIGTTLVRFLQPVAIAPSSPGTLGYCPGDEPSTLTAALDVEGLVEEDEVTVTWNGVDYPGTWTAALPTGSSFEIDVPDGAAGNPVTVTATRLYDGVTVTADLTLAASPECGA